MIHWLIQFSLRQRATILLLTVILAGFGIYSALRLPIDAVPDITNVQVMINAKTGALDPEKIEKTAPIDNT